MSTFIFSPSENAFYLSSLKERYLASASWPSDGKEVDDAIFYEFSSAAPAGKTRYVTADGYPAWGDLPPPTHEEAVATAENVKALRIEQVNTYIAAQQWPSKLALNRLNENDKATFLIWLDYLDAVSAVDTSLAPNISWPVEPT